MKKRILYRPQRNKRGEGRKDKNVAIFVSVEVKELLDTLKTAYSNCHFEGKVNGRATYNQLLRRLTETVGLAADRDVMKEFNRLMGKKEKPKAKVVKDQVTFDCIGKKVTMTIQELVDHYVEDEISKVAKECNF